MLPGMLPGGGFSLVRQSDQRKVNKHAYSDA